MKALILSGGGSKGAFQVGVLRYLHDNENVDYDIITGVSVGALNASLLATGPMDESLPLLEDVWFNKIKGNSSVWKHKLLWWVLGCVILTALLSVGTLLFAGFGPLFLTLLLLVLTIGSLFLPYFVLKHAKSVYSTNPLRKIVEKNLDVDKLKKSGKILRVGSVAYDTGKYQNVDENNPDIKKWIMASSAYPIFFPLEELEGHRWTDGGVINTAPLQDAIDAGATEIDVIVLNHLGETAEKDFGLFPQVERTLDLMTREILKNDIVNQNPNVKIRIFEPEDKFEYSALSFDPKNIRDTYELGKTVAEKVVKGK